MYKTNYTNIELVDLYPPSKVCDDWVVCADYHDRHALDLCCEKCDVYLDIIKMFEIVEVLRETSKLEKELINAYIKNSTQEALSFINLFETVQT